MRAVLVTAHGAVENLTLGEIVDPQPGPGEVVVDIRATAVNFVDLLVIGGTYQFLPPLPFVPGKLPVGVVSRLGAGVSSLHVGDRVQTLAEQGGYGGKVAVAALQCYRLPASLPFADAAAMSLVYDTAWFALVERARFQTGETVLVLGASGGVGLAALQLVKAMGGKALAGIANPEKRGLVLDAGADAIIDLSRDNLRDSLRDQVHAATAGKGVDIVLDPLGGDIFDAAVRALAWCGRLVVIGFAAGRIPALKMNYVLVKNIEISGLQVSDYRKRRPERMAECFQQVFDLHAAGKLRPLPYNAFPLDRAREALALVRDRRTNGRIVLTQEPS